MQYGERFNTISHLVAAGFSALGAAVLLYLAISKNDFVEIAAVIVYAVTTVGLYLASTLYHGSQGNIKNLLRRLDYIGIYLKIAGNYTPFMIILLRGSAGWATLAVVWALAFVGIVHEFSLGKKTRRYSLIIYGIMSLAVLPVLKNLIDALPPAGFGLIMAGYISYAIGFYFYLNDHKIKHGHGLWHIGVIGGTLFQYLCLVIYVV
ncbi:PAQR family membrane homeostasis protein TrhA [Bdellovibrio sp. HCB337]|uniref:PAQR family membrane homeostasis protein TrhA n=1 Tax=Bdellovibrio sp. HCB337 TaxID=3394358 RepID=UPI0039A51668